MTGAKVEAIKKKSKPLFANDIKERINDAVNAAIEDAIEEFVDDGMAEEDIASVVMDAMEEAIEDLKMGENGRVGAACEKSTHVVILRNVL
jgi:hypothetical protein